MTSVFYEKSDLHPSLLKFDWWSMWFSQFLSLIVFHLWKQTCQLLVQSRRWIDKKKTLSFDFRNMGNWIGNKKCGFDKGPNYRECVDASPRWKSAIKWRGNWNHQCWIRRRGQYCKWNIKYKSTIQWSKNIQFNVISAIVSLFLYF